jgi:hypothetical protein
MAAAEDTSRSDQLVLGPGAVDRGRAVVHGLERGETDYVSGWILSLAIGMIVLGTVFAVLDWCDLLPALPAAAVAGLS